MLALMKQLQPELVEARRRHKLKRRVYRIPGPFEMISFDQHDKLRPFGLNIHGCNGLLFTWIDVAQGMDYKQAGYSHSALVS